MSYEMEWYTMLPPLPRLIFKENICVRIASFEDIPYRFRGVPYKSAYLWEISGIMAAHITHPQDAGEQIADPLHHANLCMMSWIFGKLQDELVPRFNRSLVAPPFAIYEDIPRTEAGWNLGPDMHLWERTFLTYEKIKTEVSFIIPVRERSSDKCSIKLDRMREHNEFLGQSRKEFSERLKEIKSRTAAFDPRHNAPFIWVRSGTVARWLLELERGNKHHTQKQLKRDSRSQAIVKGRRKYLAEFHHAGCRVLIASAKSHDLRASSFF